MNKIIVVKGPVYRTQKNSHLSKVEAAHIHSQPSMLESHPIIDAVMRIFDGVSLPNSQENSLLRSIYRTACLDYETTNLGIGVMSMRCENGLDIVYLTKTALAEREIISLPYERLEKLTHRGLASLEEQLDNDNAVNFFKNQTPIIVPIRANDHVRMLALYGDRSFPKSHVYYRNIK